MASIFSGLALTEAKTTMGSPAATAARARPCPKFPADAVTSGPEAAPDLTNQSVPRPLNDRMGFSVSTLAKSLHPRISSTGV